MASSARIEELERKFNENPRRYFAPLANEYRKAGDLEQAIAICRTYVPQQPAHMSGHIVFGQALFEAGEHEEARGVFESALALDPENLIALRHLGDIARERGEIAAARTWYQRVLDADSRNEEVTALLAALDAPASTPRDTSPGVATWADINPERTLELPPGLLESVSRDTAISGSAPGHGAAPEAPAAPARAPEHTLQPPPPTAPRAGWPHDTPILAEEIPGPRLVDLEPMDVATPAVEPMEFALPPREPEPPPAPAATVIEEQPSAAPHGAFAAPAESGHDEASPAPEPVPDEPPAAFVTATMAELYLQQGFREEALNVYRLLVMQSPGDVALSERLAHLQGGGAPSRAADALTVSGAEASVLTIRAFFSNLARRRVAAAQSAGDDNGASGSAAGSPEEPTPGAMHGAPPTALDDVETGGSASHDVHVAEPPAGAPPAPVGTAESGAYPTAAGGDVVVEDPHVVSLETPTYASGAAGALAGMSFGVAADGYQYDVASYDAADMSGMLPAGGPSSADAAPSVEPAPEAPADMAPAPAEAAASEPSVTPDQDLNGGEPRTRKPMQTGSVNVLFPHEGVRPADETAAATLSDAFGGPSHPAPSSAGRAARPASNELSLDNIFRESPPPPEPRRAPSAFSFDQFFTDTGAGPQGPASAASGDASAPAGDDVPGGQPDAVSADAEQFSSWLAGLKKK